MPERGQEASAWLRLVLRIPGHWARRRRFRAKPRNQPRSYSIGIPGHVGVNSLQRPACRLGRTHRHEFDPTPILDGMKFLARSDTQRLTNFRRNDDLVLRGHGYG